jgi:hypothetical protein
VNFSTIKPAAYRKKAHSSKLKAEGSRQKSWRLGGYKAWKLKG